MEPDEESPQESHKMMPPSVLPERLKKLREDLIQEKPKEKYYLHIRRLEHSRGDKKLYEVHVLGDFRHRNDAVAHFEEFVIPLRPTSWRTATSMSAEFENMMISCNTLRFDASLLEPILADMSEGERELFEEWKKEQQSQHATKIKREKEVALTKKVPPCEPRAKKVRAQRETMGEPGAPSDSPFG